MNLINPVPKQNKFLTKTKIYWGTGIALVILIVVGFFVINGSGNNGSVLGEKGVSVDKTFSSIGRTSDGRPTDGNLPVKITTAEIANHILVQGQDATTRNGKLFLVLYLEIENKYQVALYSNPLDLLRLVRSDGKRIAPSVSQGNVTVRPLSVKRTNLAFVIDPNEKHFTIEVGEIKGSKEAVQINFK